MSDDSKIIAYIEGNIKNRFVWGHWDCCIFIADYVRLMTGVDPMAEFRGVYDCHKSAAVALREHGAGTLRDTLRDKFKLKKVSHARRGDIVLGYDEYNNHAAGICLGSFCLFVGDVGYIKCSISECIEAYSYG